MTPTAEELNACKTKERLMRRVRIGDSGCWEWQGSKNNRGYGTTVGGLAHRVSFKLFTGESPGASFVLHRCDNKACINPQHLYIGDAKQNARDALERGQFPRGSRNGNAKFTEEQIRWIRKVRKEGMLTLAIAKALGTTTSTIRDILNRRAWAHIP